MPITLTIPDDADEAKSRALRKMAAHAIWAAISSSDDPDGLYGTNVTVIEFFEQAAQYLIADLRVFAATQGDD